MNNSMRSVILAVPSVILSVAKDLAVLSLAAAMFVACSDDSGTSAKSSEEESSLSSASLSSSATISMSSSATISMSSSATTEDLASSSSLVSSSSNSSVPSEYSNFDFVWNSLAEWVEDCTDSLDGKIGIALYRSDKGEFLCSYDESKERWAWTKVGGISSSSVSSSSSVVASSSSSEYVPYDHSQPLASSLYLDRSRYKQFTDKRNGRSYYYLTITSKTYKDSLDNAATVTVMVENLNIGKIVKGADEQNDDTQIERYCYNDDTTYCDEYGGLYQWAEMMALPSKCNTVSCADSIKPNHQGICPEGWRLFTEDDYHIVVTSEDNTKGIEGLRSSIFNGYNASGFSLLGAGIRTVDGKFDYINYGAFWFYPAESADEPDDTARDAYINGQTSTPPYPNGTDYKTRGFSVRCTKIE